MRWVIVLCSLLTVPAAGADALPFKTVRGTAHHVRPDTHNKESGYASICEGLNGRIYVGTARYGETSHLVEFNPESDEQRIVIDTHDLCRQSATGFAAQAKIHTCNFVGPSGKIYVGSMQGHPAPGQSAADYPGGYLMTYDPGTEQAECLGQVPHRLHGVYDVVADESRGLLYVTTRSVPMDAFLWLRFDVESRSFEGLGPMAFPGAHPLLDRDRRCHVFTRDQQLATYSPETDRVTVRPLMEGGARLNKPERGGAQYAVAPDGRTAYMLFMDETFLYELDLFTPGETVPVRKHGPIISGTRSDARMDPRFGPDGNLYLVIGITQEATGPSGLRHLVRFDPATSTGEDLGVIVIDNPDYMSAVKQTGKPAFHYSGTRELPDGSLSPIHGQGIAVCRDGTIYTLFIKPFTLLRIKGAILEGPHDR